MVKYALAAFAALGLILGVGVATVPSYTAPVDTVEAWHPPVGVKGGKTNPCSPGFTYDPVGIRCIHNKR